MLWIKFATPVAWTWYVLIGTAATCSAGYLASFVLDRGGKGAEAGNA
jgi:hypothetical protein